MSDTTEDCKNSEMLKMINRSLESDYYKKYSNIGQKFVGWYLATIYHIDPIEVLSLVTDGANDKCIDAVFVDDDAQIIHIVQGKYSTGSVDSHAVEECIHASEYLSNLEDLESNCNDKLRALIPSISLAIDEGYSVRIELITTGTFTDAAIQDGYSFSDNLEKKDYVCEFEMIDLSGLEDKYNESLTENSSKINHTVELDEGQYIEMSLSGIKVVIAALPLLQCIKFPGIKNGQLFRKNVRQSLGTNKVNTAMKKSIKEDPNDFFFMHNGITAICSEMKINNNKLTLTNVNIVNGCQSMSSFYASSQQVKKNPSASVLFRFYEIPDNAKAEKISLATNAQTPVKPRDMRSVDKSVLAIKQQYESTFKGAQLMTKRGEEKRADCDPSLVIDLPHLGKMLMSWNMQRPSWAYSEQKIFDEYFTTLFGKKRASMNNADNVRALTIIYNRIQKSWDDKTIDVNEKLLSKPRYFIYDHVYAICRCISVANDMAPKTPNPSDALQVLEKSGKFDMVVRNTAKALSRAYVKASEAEGAGFSIDNWYKTKNSIEKINDMVDAMVDYDEANLYKQCLKMDNSCFFERWQSTSE